MNFGKFHRFLFPFSSKFSDLNFASYVLYNLPVLCHVSRTVSLGYLCFPAKSRVISPPGEKKQFGRNLQKLSHFKKSLLLLICIRMR